MFKCSRKILGTLQTLMLMGVMVLLAGCGQKGALYIPKDDPAAQQRATLPTTILNTVRTVKPKSPQASASAASVAPAASAPQNVGDQADPKNTKNTNLQ
jgi:predicted small lipoprotein YifL